MADETNFEVGLHVATTSDDAKLQRVVGDLQKVNTTLAEEKQRHEEATGAAAEHSSALSDLATKVAGYLAAWVGIEKIAGWLKQGTEEAITQERSLAQLAATAKAFGLDGIAAADAAKKLAEGLAAKGFEETQTLATVARLLPITKDYTQAIDATRLVAEIATARGLEYGQALTIVQALITDSPRGLIQAHRMLGVQATTAKGALQKLNETMSREAGSINDTKLAVDSSIAKWHEFWKELGDNVTPAIKYLADTALPLMTLSLKGMPVVIEDVVQKFAMWYRFLDRIDVLHPFTSLAASLAIYQDDEKKFQAESEARWKALAVKIAEDKKAADEGFKKGEDLDVHSNKGKPEEALIEGMTRDEWTKELERRRDIYLKGIADEAAKAKKLREDDAKAEEALEAKLLHDKQQMRAKYTEQLVALENKLLKDRHNISVQEGLDLQRSFQEQKAMAEALGDDTIVIDQDILAAKRATDEAAVESTITSAGEMFGVSQQVGLSIAAVKAWVAAAGAAADTEGDVFTRIAAFAAAFAATWKAVTSIEGISLGSKGGSSQSGGGAWNTVGMGTGQTGNAPMVYGSPQGQGYGQQASVSNSTSSTNYGGNTTVNVKALSYPEAAAMSRAAVRQVAPAARSVARNAPSRQRPGSGSVRS